MGPLSPQIMDAPFSIPPFSSRTGLTTITRMPEGGTENSNYAPRESPLPGVDSPPSYMPVLGGARVEPDDELGLWANQNRGMVSPDLEQRLRDAHYFPTDNPDHIPAQEWRDQHGVGYFELKRLQELYARYRV